MKKKEGDISPLGNLDRIVGILASHGNEDDSDDSKDDSDGSDDNQGDGPAWESATVVIVIAISQSVIIRVATAALSSLQLAVTVLIEAGIGVGTLAEAVVLDLAVERVSDLRLAWIVGSSRTI